MSATNRNFTDAELRKLWYTLRQCRADPLAARDFHLFRFMWIQGPRVGAMAQVTLGDARAWLSVDVVTWRDEICKRGKGYETPLRAEGKKALDALLVQRKRVPELPTDGDSPLLWSQRGAGMSVRTIQDRLQLWCKKAGLSIKASPHWLRHTAAYQLRADTQAANPEKVVERLLGHRPGSRHTGIYGQPSRQDLIDAMPPARR